MPKRANQAARPARIVHHVPGRLRIKVLGIGAEPAFFAAVQGVLSSLSGVEAVRVNPVSSSIVIDYEPTNVVFHFRLAQEESVTNWLTLEGEDAMLAQVDQVVTRSTRYLAQHSRLAETIVGTAEKMDADLRRLSDGFLDFKMLLPMAFAAATSMQKARVRGTPMWLTLGTFAFNSFIALHRHRIDAPTLQIVTGGRSHARAPKS